MPKSRVRKKKVYTPPAELRPQSTAAANRPSPTWLPALALAMICLGILWLVAFYLTQGFSDVAALSFLFDLRYWNLAIGFGLMVGALVLLARWR